MESKYKVGQRVRYYVGDNNDADDLYCIDECDIIELLDEFVNGSKIAKLSIKEWKRNTEIEDETNG